MIKRLKRAVIKWAQNQPIINDNESEQKIRLCSVSNREEGLSNERNQRMNFTIHFADGGQVIETTQYDSKRDEHMIKLYVVQNGESISEKLENIICVEALRR